MPVIFQKFIYRQDLKNNPRALYLFGDNEAHEGLGGQAKEMRFEPNAVGIPTKVRPTMEDDAFFSDENLAHNIDVIADALEPVYAHARNEGIVVIPADGLGTGLSQLPERAPKTFQYLEDALAAIP